MEKEKKCGHGSVVKGYPFELLGFSRSEGLALIICTVCFEETMIEWESRI